MMALTETRLPMCSHMLSMLISLVTLRIQPEPMQYTKDTDCLGQCGYSTYMEIGCNRRAAPNLT